MTTKPIKQKTNLRLTDENRAFLDWLKTTKGTAKEHAVNEALDALRRKYEEKKP